MAIGLEAQSTCTSGCKPDLQDPCNLAFGGDVDAVRGRIGREAGHSGNFARQGVQVAGTRGQADVADWQTKAARLAGYAGRTRR
jgi:hypothetical protein